MARKRKSILLKIEINIFIKHLQLFKDLEKVFFKICVKFTTLIVKEGKNMRYNGDLGPSMD